jgi:hypothetical protein
MSSTASTLKQTKNETARTFARQLNYKIMKPEPMTARQALGMTTSANANAAAIFEKHFAEKYHMTFAYEYITNAAKTGRACTSLKPIMDRWESHMETLLEITNVKVTQPQYNRVLSDIKAELEGDGYGISFEEQNSNWPHITWDGRDHKKRHMDYGD